MISPSPIRVILLDDEPDHLQMVQMGLDSNDRGIEAVSTTSADEALKLIRIGGFDCVVSDYLMPGMDGLRFCAKLREEGFEIPFILFTGQGSEEVAEKAFSVGVDDYLRKENTLAVYTVLAKNIRGLVERHRAEEALKVSEEKYRYLVEHAPTGIYEIDFNPTRFTSVNEEMARALGYTVEELLTIDPMKILDAESAGRFMDRVRRAQAGEMLPSSIAYKGVRKDGSTLWAQLSINFKYSGGKIVGSSVIAHDVTERKMAEEELKRTRFVLSEGQRIAHVGTFEYVVETRTTLWSDEECRIYGLAPGSPSPPYDMMLAKYIHPDDATLLNDTFTKALERGSIYELEHRIIRPDGNVRIVYDLAHPYFDMEGRLVRYIGTTLDITESKKIEGEIRKAQRTFYELVERAPFGIYIIDSQFRVSHMNLGSQEGAFRNVRPIIGRDFSEVMRILWPENVAADILSHFRHTLETGEPYYSPRFTNPRHDVEIVESYEWELHRMTLPDGQFGVICYYFDSTKLRDAEEALRVSEERYRQIVENATVGIYEIALGGDMFLSVNDATAQISGYTREELMAMKPTALLDEGSRAVFAERIRKKLAGEPIETPFEYKVVAKDGTMRTILLNDAEFRTKEGKPVSVVVIASDITDRKKAELALRDFEDRTRFALEASHTGAWDLDLVDHTAIRSLEHDRIFGYDALLPQWTYELFLEHVLPEDRPAVDRKFKHAIETKGNWDFECRIRRSDGVVRWIWAVGHHQFDESGAARRMAGIVQDITDRKQTEEVLRLRQAEIQTLFDNTPAGMVLFDAKRPYTVLVHNRYYQELFAEPYRSTGMQGLNIYQYAPEVDASGVAAVFDEVVETKKPKNYLDFPYKSDSLKETWFNWYMSPIIIEDKVVGLVSMSLDVTERHNATEALKKLNETLQQSEEELAATNEELLSSNEELRISNEHLSQSEEELAATSEELRTSQEELVKYSSSLEEMVAVRTKELAESEEKLRSLMEATEDQYFQYDENLNLVYLNNAALRLYPGQSREELVGKSITTLTPVVEKTERYKHYLHTLSTGEPTFLYNLSDPAKIPGVYVDLRVYRIGSGIVVVSNDVTKKYLAEQRVKESEERLRSFMDSANEGLSMWDSELRLLDANASWMSRWPDGYEKDRLIGKKMTELYPGIEKTERWGKYQSTLKTGEPFNYESSLVGDLVKKRIFSASVFRVGEGLGIISNDITEKMMLQEELRESANYTRTLIEASLDPLVTISREGIVTDVNAATEKISGFTRYELIGSDFSSYFTDPSAAKAGYTQVFREERVRDYPLTMRHKDGHTVDVLYNATVYLNESGDVQGVFAAARDVTEIRRLEHDLRKYAKALSESKERLQAFMDSATEGFSLYDKDLKLIEVNRVVLDRFGPGTRKEDLLGKNIRELYPGIEETEWHSAYTRILETGEPYRIEAKPGVASHSRMLLDASAFKVGDGIGVISSDVTRRIELEDRLRDAQRGDAMDKVSAMVAHDIRSPLNTAYQALEMAKLKPEQGETLVAMAEKSIKRAIEMIEDLRENTRVLTPRRQSISLTALLDDTIREKHLPASITVTTEYGEGLDSVSLDPSMLRRVVENLLSNSTEAMPYGGRIKVTARKGNREVMLSVSDTGAGIPPEIAAKIFLPLFTTKTKGIGLGLDYCKRAVEAHGGAIAFTSRPGEGTTFTISIPTP